MLVKTDSEFYNKNMMVTKGALKNIIEVCDRYEKSDNSTGNLEEVKKLKFYATIMVILMLAALILLMPMLKFIGLYGFIPYFVLVACAMFFAIKADKIKKYNDIQTYKEIVAFTEGKRLDEIQKIEEKAKRPYQKVIDGFLWAAIALLISGIMIFLLRL